MSVTASLKLSLVTGRCVRKNRCRVPVQTTDHQLAFPSCSRQSFRLALDKLNLWSPLIADKPNHNDSIFSLTMVLEEDERTGRGIPHISSTFNNKLVARLIMMVLLIMIEIVSCSPANQSGGQVELRPWGHHGLPTGVRHGQPAGWRSSWRRGWWVSSSLIQKRDCQL